MTRILALVTDAFGGYGGIARYNCDLLKALASAANDTELRVFPRIGPARAQYGGGRIIQESATFSRSLYVVRALWHAVRFRPDIIFCGHVYHGPLGHLLARLFGAKLISQLHGTEVWEPLKRKLLRPLVGSDLVLCVSRNTKARYEQQSAKAKNGFVVANTVGDHFAVGDRQQARDRFGVNNELALLTVARLDGRDGYKGHDQVIRALPSLRAPDGRDLIYLIAGIGRDRERLEQLAMILGVAERVRFLGKVPEADLPDLYRAADLFVLPSTGEGFGIVYLEAMACGTPALGLAVGGVPDALGDGELGMLVNPDADLADELQKALFASAPDRIELSRNVATRFGRGAFRARIASALQMLIVKSVVHDMPKQSAAFREEEHLASAGIAV